MAACRPHEANVTNGASVSDANRIEKKKGRPLATWRGSKEPALRMEHGVRRRVAKETPFRKEHAMKTMAFILANICSSH